MKRQDHDRPATKRQSDQQAAHRAGHAEAVEDEDAARGNQQRQRVLRDVAALVLTLSFQLSYSFVTLATA